MRDDVLVKQCLLGVGSHLGGVDCCLSGVEGGARLVDSCLELHLVECEECLPLAYTLSFVDMYFGDESCYLRADVNVGFALYCRGVGGLEVYVLRSERDGGDCGRGHLHLLALVA